MGFLDEPTTGLKRAVQLASCFVMSKEAPPALASTTSTGFSVDDFGNIRKPTIAKQIAAYRGVVYTLANTNATVASSNPMRLYVTTSGTQEKARCATSPINAKTATFLQSNKATALRMRSADNVEEVTDHPVLDLLREVNHVLNAFNLSELSYLAQELGGNAYWYLPNGPLGIPEAIWYLPPQMVRAKRDRQKIISYYEYGSGASKMKFDPEEILHFRYPDPADPYVDGISPARALWAQIALIDKETALSLAMYENGAFPRILVSPKKPLGHGEGKRLEKKWTRKFNKGGLGGIAVVDDDVTVHPVHIPPKDLENLARANVSEKRLYNGYGVPMSFSTESASLASAQAGNYQHTKNAILPRVLRFAEELSQGLASRYDSRLFFAPDNPVPADVKLGALQQRTDAMTGDTTIDERRAARGLSPSGEEWGDYPSFKDWQKATAPAPVAITTPPAAIPAETLPDEPKQDPEKMMKILDLFDTLAMYQLTTIGKRTATRNLKSHGYSDVQVEDLLALPKLADDVCVLCTDGASHKNRRLPKGDKLAKQLQKTFSAQHKSVLANLRKHLAAKKVWTPPKEWADDINLDDWTEDMAKAYKPTVEIDYKAGLDAAAQRMNMDPFSVSQPGIQKVIEDHTFKFCDTTNKTTESSLKVALKNLQDELSEELMSPERTLKELTQTVNAIFEHAEQHRAFRIAQTESSRALHNGEIAQGKESGVVSGYKLLLSDNACPICLSIAASEPETDMADALKQARSYDRTLPPLHPHCLCTQTEILIPIEDE